MHQIGRDSEIGVVVTHMKGLEEETQCCIAHPSFVFVDETLQINTQYQLLIP